MRVAVSGGFDPIHIGHVRYIREAAELGDLVVIVNGDSFLMRKKGFVFMPALERAEIIKSIVGVKEVFIFDSDTDDVCSALAIVKADVFAKGGDRTGPENIAEWKWCQENGVQIVVDIGGGKVQSSQWLAKGPR